MKRANVGGGRMCYCLVRYSLVHSWRMRSWFMRCWFMRSWLMCCVLGMAGCASTAPTPPGTMLADTNLAQSVTPGVTTRAMLLAQFGATSAIRFDSGYEVWRYLTAGEAGNHGEFVIVLDPRGIVARTRSAPSVYQWLPDKR